MVCTRDWLTVYTRAWKCLIINFTQQLKISDTSGLVPETTVFDPAHQNPEMDVKTSESSEQRS